MIFEIGDLGETGEQIDLAGITNENLLSPTMKNHLKDHFYLDVEVTRTNGEKQNYQIKLDVTEVSKLF